MSRPPVRLVEVMTLEEFKEYTGVDDQAIYQEALSEYKNLEGLDPKIFCSVWAYRNGHPALKEIRLYNRVADKRWAVIVPGTVYDPEYRANKYIEFKKELEDFYNQNWKDGKYTGRKQYGPGVSKK